MLKYEGNFEVVAASAMISFVLSISAMLLFLWLYPGANELVPLFS